VCLLFVSLVYFTLFTYFFVTLFTLLACLLTFVGLFTRFVSLVALLCLLTFCHSIYFVSLFIGSLFIYFFVTFLVCFVGLKHKLRSTNIHLIILSVSCFLSLSPLKPGSPWNLEMEMDPPSSLCCQRPKNCRPPAGYQETQGALLSPSIHPISPPHIVGNIICLVLSC
jgi:hypothetical protein